MMRPSGILLTVVFAFIALAFTVWIGRYQGEPPGVVKNLIQQEPIGPEISPTGPYPKAVTDETEYNFGVMMHDQKGEHKFTIRNEGEAPLKLVARKEDTTCSCTFGELSNDGELAPGESVDVTLNWHVKIHEGEFRHRATVRTNDPERKEIELVISGRAASPLEMQPAGTWDLGEFVTNDPVTRTGSLFSKHLESFKVKSIEAGSPVVQFTTTPMTDDELKEHGAKSGYTITATARREMPMGPFMTTAKIETDVPSMQELSFELKGVRPGPVEIIGPGFQTKANVLMLGEFPATQGKTATLSLFTRDIEGTLELKDAEQEHDSVRITMEKDSKITGKSQRYLLKIVVPPGQPQNRQRRLSEKINLIFNHPDVPPLRMYVDFLAI